jgi:HAD superfamily hydrolase (TIGR01509 family)
MIVSFAAIIFDFDGVIADSEVRANKTLAESLTAIGLPTSYEDCLRDYCGHNWRETERRIVARLGRPRPSVLRVRPRARALRMFADGFAPVSGAPEFLAALGDRPRAIASSSSPDYIAASLARFELAHHFGAHVYSADGWDKGKPHPDIYLAAAKGLHVDPAQCLAIEDSPIGARAAHGAALRAVGVHHVAHDFDDIAVAA